MIVFVRHLTNQAKPPQLPSFGHGWIQLPDGRRWNPALTLKNHEAKHEGKR
ncbi:phage filamentation protein Fil family protein [Mixta mediterraneensis]|uniref:phage filamentation protein Fil family protein n=1 Tax=Mixta mediterraneensis TaxID=2758443 RepID=UPI001875C2C1|nr:phage filamentation protein Fil family protein [Mixta mediterraneensis]MBE5254148.1 DUF2724 domain-containing protein [Mixta mediterraneensis]